MRPDLILKVLPHVLIQCYMTISKVIVVTSYSWFVDYTLYYYCKDYALHLKITAV